MTATIISFDEWKRRVKEAIASQPTETEVWRTMYGTLLPVLAAQCQRGDEDTLPSDVEPV